MDFAQTRLKLRVAVCPYVVSTGSDFHHRVVGVKRDSSDLNGSLPVLKQFLLLLPLDCTFSDLTSRALSQYEKLYQNQPAYVKIKNISVFRDSNQCDLDLDFLVSDICDSNDLIYAMVEIDESSKKSKTTEIKITNDITNSNQNIKKNSSIVSATQKVQNDKNDKKVPEFKPTSVPVKVPTVVSNIIKPEVVVPVKSTELPAKKVAPAKKEAPVKKEKIISKPITIETTKQVIVNSVQPIKVDVTKHENPVAAADIVVQATLESSSGPNPVKPTPVKKPAKKAVQDVVNSEEVNKAAINLPVKAQAVVAAATVTPAPVTTSIKVVEPVLSYSEAVTSSNTSNIITPGPTPIFQPRKSETTSSSSSEEDGQEENDSILNSFDASNLFGGQEVIASEPRRSDAFVLFAAGSESETESESDSSEEEIQASPNKNIAFPLLKSSSIVSLQAGPSSSEIDPPTSSSDDDEDDEQDDGPNSQILPHSVTLKRLNSVSPIPDSSEIPSLDELKESLIRAPTPVQILNQSHQQQQQQQQQQHQKQQNNNQSQQQVKGGRPSKKQFGGRPSVKKQQKQNPKQNTQNPVQSNNTITNPVISHDSIPNA